MNVLSLDENFVVPSYFETPVVQEIQPKDSIITGPFNLYNNQELTVWKNISGNQFASSIRFGNYLNGTGQILPSMLFYDTQPGKVFPLLDIGIQPSVSGPKAVIGFKRLEDEELVEYANIQLDGNNNLQYNSISTINKISNELDTFTENITIDDGVFLNKVSEVDVPVNTTGYIDNQDIINQFPQPTLLANAQVTSVQATISEVKNDQIILGVGLNSFETATENKTTQRLFMSLNDYTENVNSLEYDDSVYLMTDELQFNGDNFSLNKSGDVYLKMGVNSLSLNPSKMSGNGVEQLMIDDDGYLGVEAISTAQIFVKNGKVQILESLNVKNVILVEGKLVVELEKIQDIYAPRIKSKCKSRLVSDILEPTNRVEFELLDCIDETIKIIIQ